MSIVPALHCTQRLLWWAIGVALLPSLTHAATTPDAGTILQQTQPARPAESGTPAPSLTIEAPGAPPSASTSAAFEVQRIQIVGNTAFDGPTLHAQIADSEGLALTLAQLDALAARLTAYYHRHGYPLARAIIPPQTIDAGTVRIDIIEARYGKINLDNSSRVDDPLLAATLAPLRSGQLVTRADLDHGLLLLNDIPGVVVNATLSPGAAVGTSDLNIRITPGRALNSRLTLDNYGNRYIGHARVSGQLDANNLLHRGDLLNLTGLTAGPRLGYARLAYHTLVQGQGTRLGGAYSALDYSLGDTLAALDANGTAQVGSLWLSHPFVRRPRANLYGQIQYQHTQLRDHIDSVGLANDRNTRDWGLHLHGDSTDTHLLSGGTNTFSVRYLFGQLNFDDRNTATTDAATAHTQGHFSKWNVELSRTQRIGPQDSVHVSWSAQHANNNLDSSAKLSLGGPHSVRAYALGTLAGDSGMLTTLEWRHALTPAGYGQWHTLLFLDSGRVTINKNPWTTGDNRATLNGGGVGLDWSGPHHWSANIALATPLGHTPDLAGTTDSTRAWVHVGKGF